MSDPWPPEYVSQSLAEVGRIIVNFNGLESHVRGVLRMFIIETTQDRVVASICQDLTGVALERSIERFSHAFEADDAYNEAKHLVKVYQSAKSLRNRIVHETSSSLRGNHLHLSKQLYNPKLTQKGFVVTLEVLKELSAWMQKASSYTAEFCVVLGNKRGVMKNDGYVNWPDKLEIFNWEKIEQDNPQMVNNYTP